MGGTSPTDQIAQFALGVVNESLLLGRSQKADPRRRGAAEGLNEPPSAVVIDEPMVDLDQISKDAIKIERAKARVKWDNCHSEFYETLQAFAPFLSEIAGRQSQKVEDVIFKADIVAAMHDWSNDNYSRDVSRSLSDDIIALGAHRIASRFFLGAPPA